MLFLGKNSSFVQLFFYRRLHRRVFIDGRIGALQFVLVGAFLLS